ncbi:MAG: hypothetical protein J6C44_03255 [Muribaculaceae bacterium]|nr:hypothetical protein [Muribaculaceae bacterium]
MDLIFCSIETIPGIEGRAMFFASEALRGSNVDSSTGFKEDAEIITQSPWVIISAICRGAATIRCRIISSTL